MTKVIGLAVVLLFVAFVIQTLVSERTVMVPAQTSVEVMSPYDCAPPLPEPGGDDCSVPPVKEKAPTPAPQPT